MSSIKFNEKLNGKEYWRSLDQLADTPEFKEFLYREFPENASELKSSVSRRKFLTIMGASFALAGLAGCRRPVEKIVPYVKAPEEVIPGIPQYFATTMPSPKGAVGILVESHEGRPTKIEGNEMHPCSAGKASAAMQAETLNLYDPDRSGSVLKNGEGKNWKAFVKAWEDLYKNHLENEGQGLAVLSESFSSPSMYRLKQAFLKKFPKAIWAIYDPVSSENIYNGLDVAAGQQLHPVFHYDKARVVLSLDADFLGTENGSLIAANQFASGRNVENTKADMNRLYVVEQNFSITGGMADHRLRLQAGQIGPFALSLASELSKNGVALNLPAEISNNELKNVDQQWIGALAADLVKNKERSLLTAGKQQPASVHALVYMINEALGNNGKSVEYVAVKDSSQSSLNSLVELNSAMNAGKVGTLFILGGNPVYNAPADLDFTARLGKVPNTIHLSSHVDETSQNVSWHLPAAHFLEGWGDARAADGTLSVIQPLIEPLFGGKSQLELLGLLTVGEEISGYEYIRETWQTVLRSADFEKQWKKVLHDGLLTNSSSDKLNPSAKKSDIINYIKNNPIKDKAAAAGNLEIVFHESRTIFDGRYANNGWMQELPDPLTKLSWDNAVLVSPATAKELDIKTADLVTVSDRGNEIELPVFILPGHADYSLSVSLGYGRTASGRVGDEVGSDVYRLRRSLAMYYENGATVTYTGRSHKLANVQDHWSMEGRPLIREATLEFYKDHPHFAPEMVEHPPLKSLWDEPKYDEGYQWGMTIDLNKCTGCNDCVIACQSENNIPIVGKEQVSNGRELHWIRIDRYFSGDIDDPEMVMQPVACPQCETAPCEQVCPVAATSHDDEGLNVMTYNRCIGTRYCSNNCPYKVRRFNFFNYTKDYPETIKLAQNPDVTVRSRGVMEKCTYCVQRINEARIAAQNEGREIKDGEFQTACQQTCAADAIVFGNINDPGSKISQMKKNDRNYAMLGELNIKPRTTYLAKLRNPNPGLDKSNKNVS